MVQRDRIFVPDPRYRERNDPMIARTLLLGAAALMAAATVSAGSASAFTEAQIGVFHTECRAGDRPACDKRDGAIHDPAHEREWRVSHPEWYR
jgi:hypothetical protein